MALAAEVPLADECGGVAGLPERRGEGDFVERELLLEARPGERLVRPVGPARKPVGDAEPGRRLAGEQRRAGRRADGGGGVGVGEAQAGFRHRVERGGAVVLAAVAAEVGPAEVVGEDDDDVEALRGVGGGGEDEREKDGEEGTHGQGSDTPMERGWLGRLLRLLVPRVRFGPARGGGSRGTFGRRGRRVVSPGSSIRTMTLFHDSVWPTGWLG